MAHIDHSKKDSGARHPEWFKVGANIANLANEIAGRFDLVGLASPVAGSGVPACYKPLIAEIEVNTDVAFGFGVTPEMVGDLQNRDTQFEFPKATGAVMHEAFHAKYSGWNLENAFEALRHDEYEALVLLEEGRIEAWGLKSTPRAKNFLSACAMEIVIGDIEESTATEVEQLAMLVGLVHGRVIAGVLDEEDVREVLDIIESGLGFENVERLTALIPDFQKHGIHNDITSLYPIAIEWAKIVRDIKSEKGEDEDGKGEDGEAEGDSGEGSGMGELLREVMGKMAEVMEDIAVANHDELASQQESEEWKDEVDHRANKAKEEAKHRKMAGEVFGRGTGPDGAGTASRLLERRKPTAGERSAAVLIARLLEKAKYRERDVTQVMSATPGGRLRPKALVQGAALKEKGVRTPIEPWRKNVRKVTEDPTLTVGVLVDISGSMGDAMQPMAVTAWVMSEAVKRVQGKCAMVYYGSDVFATLKAGQHLDEVTVYSAPDGTEKFDKAFQAINGSLNLLDGSGARMLVVVSDGHYTGEETKATRKWVARCEQAGVAVLWLPFDNGYTAERLVGKYGATVVAGKLNPVEAASKIGQACAKALTKIGNRN